MRVTTAPQFFDAVAGRYDRAYAPSGHESRERMTRVLGALPSEPLHVLDLGVGTGRELSSLIDAGHFPTGLDASRAMLERCARRVRTPPLVWADFWDFPLPFGRSSFDAAIALHGTLAHPPDASAVPRLALELARVVRPGGWLVAEVASPAWLEAAASAPRGRQEGGDCDSDDPRFRRTGRRAGLIEDSVVGVGVEVRLLDESEWRAALRPNWRTELRTLSPAEWLLVAERV